MRGKVFPIEYDFTGGRSCFSWAANHASTVSYLYNRFTEVYGGSLSKKEDNALQDKGKEMFAYQNECSISLTITASM